MADAETVRADHYLAPETLAQLAPFELRAKMVVEGVMSGLHRSPFQGMAVAFAQHRQYVPGHVPQPLARTVLRRADQPSHHTSPRGAPPDPVLTARPGATGFARHSCAADSRSSHRR